MRLSVRSFLGLCIFVSGCSCSKNEATDVPTSYSQPDPEVYERSVPVNPYDDGSGHSAGYEWAQENEVVVFDGNSESFIEGCEEYVRQSDEGVSSGEIGDDSDE